MQKFIGNSNEHNTSGIFTFYGNFHFRVENFKKYCSEIGTLKTCNSNNYFPLFIFCVIFSPLQSSSLQIAPILFIGISFQSHLCFFNVRINFYRKTASVVCQKFWNAFTVTVTMKAVLFYIITLSNAYYQVTISWISLDWLTDCSVKHDFEICIRY